MKLAFLLVLAALVSACVERPGGDDVICLDKQRNIDSCFNVYQPVCAYPIAKTYANSCHACSDPKVDFYSYGECKKK
jgi:hypothetical protein